MINGILIKITLKVYTKDELVKCPPKIEANKGQYNQNEFPKMCESLSPKCFASQGLTECLDDIVSLPFAYALQLSGPLWLLLEKGEIWT